MKKLAESDLSWMENADCSSLPTEWWTETAMIRGPKAWRSEDNNLAQLICQDCPERRTCDRYADDIGANWGIYAGLRPDQREARREARRINAKQVVSL